jgi:hypothetical protein
LPAYKRAVLNAIDYLSKFGYSREQIYLLLSCAPSEGRISGQSGSRRDGGWEGGIERDKIERDWVRKGGREGGRGEE